MKAKSFVTIIFMVLAALLVNFSAFASAPQGLNYQAVVRNSSGIILPNQAVNMRFSIRSDSINGSIKYSETDSGFTNALGIFTVIIGGGNIFSGSFDSIHWAACSHFLQVEMDVTGGNNFLQMGTSQLVSVPYALYAKSAGSVSLTPTMYPTIAGSDTIVVGTSSYIIVTSTVTPSAAPVTLTRGTFPGQMLCIAGASMGSNGVRFANGGLLNIGTGGNNDILKGSTMMLMWSGTQWLQISYSGNQ
jgi:hypothetical protein